MNAKVTVEFVFENVCNKEDLNHPKFNTLEKMVKMLIKAEGICGIIDPDKCKVVKVEEIK